MEHEVALKQNWQKIIDCCGEDYIGEKVKILAKRRDEDYDCKPDVSVYKLFPANALPYYVSEEYMATKSAVSFILRHINNYAEIRTELGRGGVELAERIRTAAVAKKRKLSGELKSIVVSEIKLGSQSRVIICDYETAVIIDVVRIRTDYDGTETLEGFAQRLYAIKPNINVYCVETRHEVFEKFSKLGFINVYTNPNEIENNDITAKITKSHSSVSAKISDHFTTCKKLDKYFPFMQFLQKIR